MTYTTSVTLVRPNRTVPFQPEDSGAAAMQDLRNDAPGYVSHTRVHSGNTLTLTHVWDSKDNHDDFTTANHDALAASRTLRNTYYDANGITVTSTQIEE